MLESLLDPWRWERSFQDFPDYLAGFGMTLKVTVVGWLIAHGNRYFAGVDLYQGE